MRFDQLTQEMGMLDNRVASIAQDPTGYMWFGTDHGLHRFDAYTFAVFIHDPDDARSLSGNIVDRLLVDSDGVLWAGTDNGLCRYDPATESFQRYLHEAPSDDRLNPYRVTALHENSNGALCVGTNQGLFLLDRETGKLERLTRELIRGVAEDRLGGLWVGDVDGDLLYRPPDGGEFSSLLVDEAFTRRIENVLEYFEVITLFQSPEGEVWVTTWGGGVLRIDPQEGTVRRYLDDVIQDDPVHGEKAIALLFDPSGVVWVGSFNYGLVRLDPESGEYYRIRHQPGNALSLSDDAIQSLYMDNAGTLWVGTLYNAVNFHNPSRYTFVHHFHVPGDLNSLSHSLVFALLEDRDGIVWIGTHEGGLNRYDPSTGRFVYFAADLDNPHGLSSSSVLSLLQDRNGMIWLGTMGADLCMLDPHTLEFRRVFLDPSKWDRSESITPVCRALLEDSRGRVWIGSEGHGLFAIDPVTSQTRNYFTKRDAKLTDHERTRDIRALAEDKSGHIWIGTDRDGLLCLDPDTGEARVYLHDPDEPRSLAHNIVRTLCIDEAGRIWVGTSGGLDLYNPETDDFAHYRPYTSPADQHISGIEYDDEGLLWLSTTQGLVQFDPETGTFTRYFTPQDGLQGYAFHSGVHCAGPEGRLYFGGANGFNVFRPDEIQRAALPPPPVVVTECWVQNSPRKVARGDGLLLQLQPRENSFSLEFAALSYVMPERNLYSYRLEGFEDAWSPPSARRYASYPRIPPGDYTFHVRAANAEGVWNNDGVTVSIAIPTPLWKTTAFRVLATLAFATAILLIFYLRIHQVRRANRRLEETVAARTAQLAEANRSLQEEIESRKRAETERRELEDRIRQSQKLESLTVMAGSIAHNFNNILMGVLGNIDLACLHLSGDSEARRKLERAGSEARRAADLSRLMLTYVGQGQTEFRRIDLTKIIADMTDMFQAIVSRKTNLRMDLSQTPTAVSGDPSQLQQVVMNLVTNAVEALGDSPGEISLSTGYAECDEDTLKDAYLHEDVRPGWFVFLQVSDTGPGMDEEIRRKAFDPFFTTKFQGRGLGLAAVLGVVRGHFGALFLDTQPGSGTTVGILFPAEKPGQVAVPDSEAAETAPVEGWRGAGKILLVDDEEGVRAVVGCVLRNAGFEVLEASDGAAGLRSFQRQIEDIRAVVLDIAMPRMDGREALALMRELRPDLPVLVISGYDEHSVSDLTDGQTFFLQKPFEILAFLGSLRKLLEHAES